MLRTARALLTSFALAAAMAAPALEARAGDLAGMAPEDIAALQRRLADAGCYTGAVDGAASAATVAAVKACPEQDPALRIETGMHTASIKRIGIDANCSVMATSSDDKTVRIWSLPRGTLTRTQRLPIGGDHGGKLFAVAVSPDGSRVAAGGWDAYNLVLGGHAAYVFDTATGNEVRRIGQFGNVINDLAFSPDGKRLAVALWGKEGVRVMDVDSGTELAAFRDYGDSSYGVGYGPDGSLYGLSYDGTIHLYDTSLREIARATPRPGQKPYSVAASPDGKRVAVAYDETGAVDILDARSLAVLAKADARGVTNGDLSKVAWSSDGRSLYAGGLFWSKFKNSDGTEQTRRVVRRFDANGKRIGQDLPVSANTVTALRSCSNAIVYAAADPAFGYILPDGRMGTLGKSHAADMRGKNGTGFSVSEDGTRVRFGLGLFDEASVLFDLGTETVRDAPKPVDDLVSPVEEGLPVTDWQHNYEPKFDGRKIALETYEMSRALAVKPDRSGFVLGTDFYLRSFRSDGKQAWAAVMPSVAWGADLARNGDLAVAAIGDGTIRWYRNSDGKELLALFVDTTDKRWAAWTPTGYYMASAGGEDLIGWHINRGWNQQADFFPASRLRERFNRPDVVKLVLTTLDEGEAVRQANAVANRQASAAPIITRLPPVVTITGPAEGTRFTTEQVTLDYDLRSPSGLAVDALDVLIDGRPMGDTRGLARVEGAGATKTPVIGAGRITVTLPARDVSVALVAHAGQLTSEAAQVRLAWGGEAQQARGADLLKPKLYALVVGVSDYADPSLTLGYAGKDAKDFAAALSAQSGGLYGGVEARVLADGEATRDAVLDGLDWLSAQVTSRDVGMVFLAGHGVSDSDGYWYLPVDAKRERLHRTAVSEDDVRRTLRKLPGKVILFLDTCHAGKLAADSGVVTRGAVDVNAIVNDLAGAETGVVAFASSTGREVSMEKAEWGNGAFTKALIEGLGGKADLLNNGTVTLSQLDAFVVNRVKELTGGAQHAVMTRPPTVGDYPIALVGR